MEWSISKGCFLTKSKTKNPKGVLSRVLFQKLHGETKANAEIRQKAFNHCWKLVEQRMTDFTANSEQKLLKQFEEYFSRCCSQHLFNNTGGIVPAAIVHEGVSSSSDDSLLCRLKEYLCADSSKGFPVTVLLKLSDITGTNVKSLFKAIMQQLVLIDEEDKTTHMKLPDCSISTLCGWYSEYIHESESERVPVCILIDEFESFPLNVFQELVAVLSSRATEFPAILVLGLQLPMNLHLLLSNSTFAKLSITEFSNECTEDFMRRNLEKMLVNPDFPVKISAECCEILLDNFKFTESSIASCMSQIKSLLLDHFYWQPLSFISAVKLEKLKDCIRNLSHDQCEMIRAMPSFRSYIEQHQMLLNNDDALKITVNKFLKQITEYHVIVLPLIQSLLYFTIDSDGKNQIHCKIDILIRLHRDTVSNVITPLFEYFSVSSTVEYKHCLEQCVIFLKQHKPQSRSQRAESAMSILLNNLTSYNTQLNELMQKSPVNSRAVENIKIEITKFLKEFYCEKLKTYKEFPLHEIYYFSNASRLRKQITVSPKESVVKALNMPQYYLKTPDCSATDCIPLPYPFITYQQYKSMGRIIPVSEWMEACCPSDNKTELLREQAGFLQSIAEMQFVGLHKPLPQKTGSVLKLFWDSTT